ncbi:DUF3997 domain-containing protein [Peribacillus butanolivorans]
MLNIAIISLLLFSGCAGLSDYDVDLPGKYSIVRTSAHNVFIAPKEGEGRWGSPIIPTEVTEIAWDENYIMAKQVELKEDPESENGYEIPDEESYHFWIVEIETGKATGPLDEQSFMEKRSELKIADDIILKDVYDIK